MTATLWIVGIILCIAMSVVLDRARLRKIAHQREGDSICTFVRSLDYRALDTKVIREVYEQLQTWLRCGKRPFPVRVADDLHEDYKMDPLDLDDLIVDVAQKTGRDLSDTSKNPYYDRVDTVADVIGFLCSQPRITKMG
jgi:acyl carrier protein